MVEMERLEKKDDSGATGREHIEESRPIGILNTAKS